ncbi:MAG: hypothetical protein IJK99_09920, partial [Bacteroidales bacterium]|nr:hypothetical protein [Bacteroidales bacterium]
GCLSVVRGLFAGCLPIVCRMPSGWVDAAVGRMQIGCLKNNFCRIEIFNYLCSFEINIELIIIN